MQMHQEMAKDQTGLVGLWESEARENDNWAAAARLSQVSEVVAKAIDHYSATSVCRIAGCDKIEVQVFERELSLSEGLCNSVTTTVLKALNNLDWGACYYIRPAERGLLFEFVVFEED